MSIKKFVVAVFLIGTTFANSQDLIVTKKNDSIACKITKIKKEYLYFIFKNEGKFENTLISKNEVLAFEKGFYPTMKIPKDSIPGYEQFSRHLLSINGGLATDPGKRDPNFLPGFEDYMKDLRTGYQVEFSYSYFLTEKLGIGLTASYFSTNAQEENVQGTDGFNNPVESLLSNDIQAFFIGASLPLRFFSRNKKNAFIWNTSIGYIDYQDSYFFVERTISNGQGFGTMSTFGYNFGINDNLSFGIQLGLVASYFRNIQVTNENTSFEVELSDNRPLGSSRVDFSMGIRYHFP